MAHTAFVAGATGFTGRSVATLCAGRGITTYAHVRPDSRELARWQKHFAAAGVKVDSTRWEPEALKQRLQELKPTLLFACLGTTRHRAKREQLTDPYEQVDYGLTVMLLDAARDLQPAPRFIYLSAMGVRSSGNAYINARWRVEQALAKSPLPHLIARPGLIAGDRDESRPLEEAVHWVARAVAGTLDAVGARGWANGMRPLTGEQLGSALVQLALDPPGKEVVPLSTLAALGTAPGARAVSSS